MFNYVKKKGGMHIYVRHKHFKMNNDANKITFSMEEETKKT